MKRKLLLAFLSVCFAIIISAGTAWAAEGTVESGECGAEGDNVVWTLEDGTLTISGKGAMADYESDQPPWNIDFDVRDSIRNVVIEEGVTSIGVRAFASMGLKSIVIPDGVTNISDNAFIGCSELTSIVFPQGLLSIGAGAFCYCDSLVEIYLPEGLSTIGNSAFARCLGLGV